MSSPKNASAESSSHRRIKGDRSEVVQNVSNMLDSRPPLQLNATFSTPESNPLASAAASNSTLPIRQGSSAAVNPPSVPKDHKFTGFRGEHPPSANRPLPLNEIRSPNPDKAGADWAGGTWSSPEIRTANGYTNHCDTGDGSGGRVVATYAGGEHVYTDHPMNSMAAAEINRVMREAGPSSVLTGPDGGLENRMESFIRGETFNVESGVRLESERDSTNRIVSISEEDAALVPSVDKQAKVTKVNSSAACAMAVTVSAIAAAQQIAVMVESDDVTEQVKAGLGATVSIGKSVEAVCHHQKLDKIDINKPAPSSAAAPEEIGKLGRTVAGGAAALAVANAASAIVSAVDKPSVINVTRAANSSVAAGVGIKSALHSVESATSKALASKALAGVAVVNTAIATVQIAESDDLRDGQKAGFPAAELVAGILCVAGGPAGMVAGLIIGGVASLWQSIVSSDNASRGGLRHDGIVTGIEVPASNEFIVVDPNVNPSVNYDLDRIGISQIKVAAGADEESCYELSVMVKYTGDYCFWDRTGDCYTLSVHNVSCLHTVSYSSADPVIVEISRNCDGIDGMASGLDIVHGETWMNTADATCPRMKALHRIGVDKIYLQQNTTEKTTFGYQYTLHVKARYPGHYVFIDASGDCYKLKISVVDTAHAVNFDSSLPTIIEVGRNVTGIDGVASVDVPVGSTWTTTAQPLDAASLPKQGSTRADQARYDMHRIGIDTLSLQRNTSSATYGDYVVRVKVRYPGKYLFIDESGDCYKLSVSVTDTEHVLRYKSRAPKLMEVCRNGISNSGMASVNIEVSEPVTIPRDFCSLQTDQQKLLHSLGFQKIELLRNQGMCVYNYTIRAKVRYPGDYSFIDATGDCYHLNVKFTDAEHTVNFRSDNGTLIEVGRNIRMVNNGCVETRIETDDRWVLTSATDAATKDLHRIGVDKIKVRHKGDGKYCVLFKVRYPGEYRFTDSEYDQYFVTVHSTDREHWLNYSSRDAALREVARNAPLITHHGSVNYTVSVKEKWTVTSGDPSSATYELHRIGVSQIRVVNDGGWFFNHSLEIKVRYAGTYRFTDRTGDTYKLWVSNTAKEHTVNFDSKNGEIWRISRED